MSEKPVEKMREAAVVHDTRLLGDFAVIYCKGNHAGAAKAPLASEGVSLGVYGTEPPIVCERCADLLAYAEKRRAYCPKDPKPFCSHCDTHCYTSEQAEYMREVMRYAGPRSLLHGHAIDGIRHVIDGRKAKKAAVARAAAITEREESR
jgi:Nitrous oxide-stimulated promoter